MFTDTVTLQLIAGKGGNGIVAWRREKFIPKGGPAGGDGGHGGSITIEATPQLFSLEDYRNTKKVKAKNGVCGGPNNRKGKNGPSITLSVPLGTIVRDAETNEVLFDFTEEGQKFLICQGGKGGKGNSFFKSSTNRAPTQFTEGKHGQEKEVTLELKLIADIGLVGMPNAGKSTLISTITQLPVKIAPYPFTTLRPNLGLLEFEDYTRILIADIPGIIRDAHQDRGLGLSFLKHIERTSALLFVIDVSGVEKTDPFEDFCILQKEIQAYNPEMRKKPFIVALNKVDVEDSEVLIEDFQKKYPFDPKSLFVISAKEGVNLSLLKEEMYRLTRTDAFQLQS